MKAADDGTSLPLKPSWPSPARSTTPSNPTERDRYGDRIEFCLHGLRVGGDVAVWVVCDNPEFESGSRVERFVPCGALGAAIHRLWHDYDGESMGLAPPVGRPDAAARLRDRRTEVAALPPLRPARRKGVDPPAPGGGLLPHLHHGARRPAALVGLGRREPLPLPRRDAEPGHGQPRAPLRQEPRRTALRGRHPDRPPRPPPRGARRRTPRRPPGLRGPPGAGPHPQRDRADGERRSGSRRTRSRVSSRRSRGSRRSCGGSSRRCVGAAPRTPALARSVASLNEVGSRNGDDPPRHSGNRRLQHPCWRTTSPRAS